MAQSDIVRVTFNASIDAGEGWLTNKNEQTLSALVDDYGGLWVLDVIKDWQHQMDLAKEMAMAAFSAEMHNVSVKAGHSQKIETHKDLAHFVWEQGAWPDMYTCSFASPCEYANMDYEAEKYACSKEFFDWMIEKAKAAAQVYVDGFKDKGVQYPHGRHPSFEDLTKFYVYKLLAGKGDNPSDVFNKGTLV